MAQRHGARADEAGESAAGTASRSRPATSFAGRRPASPRASAAARRASKKSDTGPEMRLRRALWARGLRYRKDERTLPGRPDIVFAGARLVVFCDGDFWHGKDWEARRAKLATGHNAPYWIAKIERNLARDRERTAELEASGWRVARFWESEIKRELERVVETVIALVREGSPVSRRR